MKAKCVQVCEKCNMFTHGKSKPFNYNGKLEMEGYEWYSCSIEMGCSYSRGKYRQGMPLKCPAKIEHMIMKKMIGSLANAER